MPNVNTDRTETKVKDTTEENFQAAESLAYRFDKQAPVENNSIHCELNYKESDTSVPQSAT